MNTPIKAGKSKKSVLACAGIVSILLIVSTLLAACAPMEVIKTVELEKEVVRTVEVMKEIVVEGQEQPAAKPQGTQVASGESDSNTVLTAYNSAQPAMIIKDGSIDLLVADTDRAVDQVTALAQQQGGYVISSNTWIEDGYKYADFRLGVPSGLFEQTMSALRRLGVQVLNEASSGQDVSSEYADLQTRLTNLEATAARVRSFLEDAKTVEEALQVNNTLSQLEAEMAQIKGQMKFYEGRSAYSTISVSLKPQRPTPTPTLTPTLTPTPTSTPRWNPGGTFQDAAKTSVKFMQGTVDALIWIVVMLWPLILLAGIVLYFYIRRKKSKKHSKEISS